MNEVCMNVAVNTVNCLLSNDDLEVIKKIMNEIKSSMSKRKNLLLEVANEYNTLIGSNNFNMITLRDLCDEINERFGEEDNIMVGLNLCLFYDIALRNGKVSLLSVYDLDYYIYDNRLDFVDEILELKSYEEREIYEDYEYCVNKVFMLYKKYSLKDDEVLENLNDIFIDNKDTRLARRLIF